MDWLDIKEFFKDTIHYIIIIAVILVIALYVLTLQQVVGPSMQTTLMNGDVVLLDRLTSRYLSIKKNDVIAFYDENSKYLIKRVIGLPGDTVEIKDNVLYVNGNVVNEPYLDQGVVTSNFELQSLGYDQVQKDMYFVLGDNRENSMDSRDKRVGLVPRKDIIGKVRVRIWPINKFKVVR